MEAVKPPILPPPERSAEFWLSHPSVVLLSAQSGIGVDTIMEMTNAFNNLYKGRPELGVDEEDNDHTIAIRPHYSGQKGEGPSPVESRKFFTEQARRYHLTRKQVAEAISEVYRTGNKFIPMDN